MYDLVLSHGCGLELRQRGQVRRVYATGYRLNSALFLLLRLPAAYVIGPCYSRIERKQQPSLDNNARQACDFINNSENPCCHDGSAFTYLRSVGG
jgi:hypothetical protein